MSMCVTNTMPSPMRWNMKKNSAIQGCDSRKKLIIGQPSAGTIATQPSPTDWRFGCIFDAISTYTAYATPPM